MASPLTLILAGRAAQEEHIREHGGDEGFDERIVNAHIELFSLWCIGVHQGQVEESRSSIAPDNGELAAWSARLHREHILPSLELASAVPPSTTDTTDLLQSLATGITRTTEEAKHQNKIQRKQLDYLKEKDARKKNKAEKWHHICQRLVLNTASINSNSPSKEIPESYLRIINRNTAGMANRELQHQMSELSFLDASFAHGLATSLFMGDIMWNTWTTPSNLSPFTIFELDPLSSTQTASCLHLHLLSNNTEGKSLDKINASQIQEIKALGTFEELLQALQFYMGITTILFGPCSALVIGTKSITTAIQSKKKVFKTCIATNGKFPTKFLYPMEIRTQRWLGKCQKHSNRLMVNDRLICFEKVLETVLNSSLNVSLPPNFIKPSPKKPMPELTPKPGDNRKRKNNKRKTDKVREERVIKNAALITEFVMKDDEVWKRNFAEKCTRDCPKWDNNTFM